MGNYQDIAIGRIFRTIVDSVRTALTARTHLTFGDGFTITDNPAENETLIEVTGGGGGGGGTEHIAATLAALKALANGDVADGETWKIANDPGKVYSYSAGTGAGLANNDLTIIKRTATGVDANPGRFYLANASAVVPTYAAARLATSTVHNVLQVQARTTAGDGGEGAFYYDSSDTTSSDNGGTILVAGTRRYKRRFNGAIDARWFGVVAYPTLAAASSGTDSYAALLAATRAVSSISAATAHRVDLPYGYVRCSSTLEISRRVYLKGHGKSNSVLVFSGTVAGIQILHPDLSSDGGDGSGSTLEDFSVWAVSTAGNVDGIWINANDVHLNRVDSLYWGRWTFTIFGSVPGTQGNANDWRMTQCSSWYAGLAGSGDDRGGLYVHGNDSSAGCNSGFRALQVTGIGIREESFLGNYHEQCHVEIASGVSYKTRPGQVSRSTFAACYAEGAQPIQIYYPNVWIGGFAGNGFASDCDGLIMPDGNGVYPFGVPNRESGSDSAVFYAGDYGNALGSGAQNAVFGWLADGVSINTENYSLFWNTTSFKWDFRRHATDLATYRPFFITGWGHSRPHSHFGVHQLLVDDVRITTGTGAPSTGLWRKGDIQIETAPTVGGAKFRVCTTAGGWASAWVANTIYANHTLVAPTTPNGYVYEMVSYNSGTSHASIEPTWPTTPGDTVTDNGMTWKNVGVTPAVFDTIESGADGAPGDDGADADLAYTSQGLTQNQTIGFAAASADITIANKFNQVRLVSDGLGGWDVTCKNAGATQGDRIEFCRTDIEDASVNIKDDSGTLLYVMSPAGDGLPGAATPTHTVVVYTGAAWILWTATSGVA